MYARRTLTTSRLPSLPKPWGRKRGWRPGALPRIWGKPVFALADAVPGALVYWILISSGYKTYRSLSVFFREFNRAYMRPTPPHIQRMIDTLGMTKFLEKLHDAQVQRAVEHALEHAAVAATFTLVACDPRQRSPCYVFCAAAAAWDSWARFNPIASSDMVRLRTWMCGLCAVGVQAMSSRRRQAGDIEPFRRLVGRLFRAHSHVTSALASVWAVNLYPQPWRTQATRTVCFGWPL